MIDGREGKLKGNDMVLRMENFLHKAQNWVCKHKTALHKIFNTIRMVSGNGECDVFFRLGQRMKLKGLPENFTEWQKMHAKQLGARPGGEPPHH